MAESNETSASHGGPPGIETVPGSPDALVDRRRFVQESAGDVMSTVSWVLTALLGKYRPWLRYFNSLPNDARRYEPIMPMSTRQDGPPSQS